MSENSRGGEGETVPNESPNREEGQKQDSVQQIEEQTDHDQGDQNGPLPAESTTNGPPPPQRSIQDLFNPPRNIAEIRQ
ncbi:MAG: hypothetical protein Q9183_004580, partial [Haloplaca sp. 2 TL-2023]